MKQLIMLVDLDRCIDCSGCVVSCKTINGVALGKSRVEVYKMGPSGEYPNLEMYTMPVMCQQCENPSCAESCPTSACAKSEEDGVVYIDKDMCMGCKSCERACPYSTLLFNEELHVMDKCNLCEGLRENDEMPACARNCAGNALTLGDINDPSSEVSKKIEDAGPENIYALEKFENNPSVRYILKNAKWIDTIPYLYKNN